MKYEIELGSDDVKDILAAYLTGKFRKTIEAADLVIETKSAQNYKSTWEGGAGWRCRVDMTTPPDA